MIATSGDKQLRWLLPGVQDAEKKLRAFAASKGITYRIADFGGARTESIVALLLRWRDEAVAKGEPSYRVSGYKTGKHPVGGAFDIRIVSAPAGMSDDAAYRVLGMQAPQYGLQWGGLFGTPADPFHFESHQTRAQLEARWLNWINDPAYPSGYIDPLLMIFLAIIGGIILYLMVR